MVHMNDIPAHNHATVATNVAGNEAVSITLGGRLDDATLPSVWSQVLDTARRFGRGSIDLDVSQIVYCDGAGLGLFAELRRVAAQSGSRLTFRGFTPDLQRLVERSALADPSAPELQPTRRLSFVQELGKATSTILNDLRAMVTFLGHLLSGLAWALRHPRRIRYRDLFLVAEKAGVDGAPVVCLLGLLIGVILAFQCAIPMRRYGAQEAIPAVVSIALARELGPLIAAVLFAGRSGSAFTAEIGTMTITEEVAALKCMGLDPVRFLVVPRVLAAMAMLPLLATLCDLTGILGGYSVMTNYGFSFMLYVSAVRHAISYSDLLGGIAKTVAFGAIIAGVGCLRGLRTANGPGAVGDSTTRSVVESIVLIIITDALFGVIYYYVGI
jgi:phospholipid/cholesterol/gamma-HCH transport system permease protein